MKYLLLLLALTVSAGPVVCSAGKLQVWERSTGLWTGEPKALMIVCISDSQYQYLYVENPEPALFRNINRTIAFCGKLRTEIIDVTHKKYFITLKDWK